MKRCLVAVLLASVPLLVTPIICIANQPDYSASIGGRTTPIGLNIKGVGGYGLYVWGDPSTPFYGYLRPSVAFSASTILGGTASIDFYPVSFFGVTAGRSYSNRLADLPGLDCAVADCRGWLNDTFVQARLLGKYESIVGSLSFVRKTYDDNDDQTKSFGEATHVVKLAAKNEQSDTWLAILGYAWDEELKIGVSALGFTTDKSAERQDQQLFFVAKKLDTLTYTAAAGRFYSSQYGAGPEVLFSVEWTGLKKIGP